MDVLYDNKSLSLPDPIEQAGIKAIKHVFIFYGKKPD